MGALTYDGTEVEFDDRVLAHLQVVIVQRFLQRRSCLMSWREGVHSGHGRSSIWLAPNIPLGFTFSGSDSPEIDEGWLLSLGQSAQGPTGLIVASADGTLIESGPTTGTEAGSIRETLPVQPH